MRTFADTASKLALLDDRSVERMAAIGERRGRRKAQDWAVALLDAASRRDAAELAVRRLPVSAQREARCALAASAIRMRESATVLLVDPELDAILR